MIQGSLIYIEGILKLLFYFAGEHCEMYVKQFESLFGTDALAEMVLAS